MDSDDDDLCGNSMFNSPVFPPLGAAFLAATWSMQSERVGRAAVGALTAIQVILQEDESDDNSDDFSVHPAFEKIPRLDRLASEHGSIFKSVSAFTLSEFEELCAVVCPVIEARTCNTPKRTPTDRLLNMVLHLSNATVTHESSNWNSGSALPGDIVFVAEIVRETLAGEIAWPKAASRELLRQRLNGLPGCIGHVDGTLCKISRPSCEGHRAYLNGRKKMYCFNSTVVVDHDGRIIFVAAGYPGSFHDARVLQATPLAQNWQQFFTVDDSSPGPCEYLLGALDDMGMDKFILSRTDVGEVPNENWVAAAFNKMHAGHRVKAEWGISGLKGKFGNFLNTATNRPQEFKILFEAACIFTNFLHRRRQNFAVSILTEGAGETQEGEGEWS